MTVGPSASANPLDEIRRVERAAAIALDEATSAAEGAVAEARARSERLVQEARARGELTAARRYEEGMTRAHDAVQRMESVADSRIAALRQKAEPHLAAAVDAVIAFVLPQEES